MDNAELCRSFLFRFFELDNPQPIHTFADFHFIAYVYDGTGYFSDDHTSITVSPGDFFYIPFELLYRSQWRKLIQESPVRFLSLGCRYFPQADNIHYPLQRLESTPETVKMLDGFTELPPYRRTKGGLVYPLRVDCETAGLFYQLLAVFQKRMVQTQQNRQYRLAEQAKRYWLDHPFACMPETARHCRVSERVLYSAFQVSCGKTPVRVKHQLLIQSAAEMLRGTDKSIEKIAEELGFSSAAYFRKIYHEVMGFSPRETRRGRWPDSQ